MKISQEAKKKIQRLSNTYQKRRKKMDVAAEALDSYVREYMTKHNMWDNQNDIMEMIDQLPPGYLRFTLYERYHELQKIE